MHRNGTTGSLGPGHDAVVPLAYASEPRRTLHACASVAARHPVITVFVLDDGAEAAVVSAHGHPGGEMVIDVALGSWGAPELTGNLVFSFRGRQDRLLAVRGPVAPLAVSLGTYVGPDDARSGSDVDRARTIAAFVSASEPTLKRG